MRTSARSARSALSALSALSAADLTCVVLAALMLAAPPPVAAQATQASGNTQFLVFFRSQPVGREEVAVLKLQDGWVVRGTSRLGQPIDITSRVAEVNYDLEWRPKSLHIDSIVRGQDVSLKTTFANGRASNAIAIRSEERRVGKECRYWLSQYPCKRQSVHW